MEADTLAAARVSAAVRRAAVEDRWVGRVHSVFGRAANVLVGDELITIVAPGSDAPPNGIVLAAPADIGSLKLVPGQLVCADDGLWRFSSSVALDASRAAIWSPWLPGRAVSNGTRAGECLHALAAEIVAQGGMDRLHLGLGPLIVDRSDSAAEASAVATMTPLAQRAESAIATTCDALIADDVPGAVGEVAVLIGLGPGLTPSGDDFIVGLCAMLRAGRHPGAQEFAERCAALASELTTVVARAYLSCAARGAFGESVHELIEALLGERTMDARLQARRLLDWGATSGVDLLVGVKAGLSVLLGAEMPDALARPRGLPSAL